MYTYTIQGVLLGVVRIEDHCAPRCLDWTFLVHVRRFARVQGYFSRTLIVDN